VRKAAKEHRVPLIDYQAPILKRRPDDWDGSLAKFKEVPGGTHDEPTVIARDGVHPSNPAKYNKHSEEEPAQFPDLDDVRRRLAPGGQSVEIATRSAHSTSLFRARQVALCVP
jgi:hypothetical protein